MSVGSFSRLQKLTAVAVGALGGGFAYYRLSATNEQRHHVANSWTTNYTPSVKWDDNWDHRHPTCLVKPVKDDTPDEENRFNCELEKAKPKAVRHLILIRHGQYNVDGATDKQRVLTELGRTQADLTGRRLASLDVRWDLLVRSTMSRAQETATLIAKHLPPALELRDCQLLEEGAPVPPEPPVGHWKPEPKQFFQEGARIEAAYRKYFHRASPDQDKDTYTILVCHANVIRYFVCKALQFPPEGWLRISLNHGSVTWLSVHPSGRVVLRGLGDTGHMDPKWISSRNSRMPKKR